MIVLILEYESKIFAIFLLYVFPNTRPIAFDILGLINVLPMLQGFFSVAIIRVISNDASTISTDRDWWKHLQF